VCEPLTEYNLIDELNLARNPALEEEPVDDDFKTSASIMSPIEFCVSAAGIFSAKAILDDAPCVWVADGDVLGGRTVAIVDYASFPAILVMSTAASVLGNRTSVGDCARIESRTFGSRRITPASGGENFRNPSQAFKIVL